MKNKDLVYFNFNLLANLSGTQFAYIVAKNISLIRDEVEFLLKARPKEYIEFEAKRLDLAKEYAIKDELERPIVRDGNFSIGNTERFEMEISRLKDTYKGVIDEYTILMEVESELKFYKVKLSDCPVLTVAQMGIILPWVEESNDKSVKE